MRKFYPIHLRIVMIVLLCLLLTACNQQPVETEPTTEPTVYYTARFVMGGNVLSEQTLEEGQLPEAVEEPAETASEE